MKITVERSELLKSLGHVHRVVERRNTIPILANVLIEALKRTGPQLDTERLVGTLESLRSFDMGLGTLVNFGPAEHQGLHKVWGTQLDASGHYQAIELQ